MRRHGSKDFHFLHDLFTFKKQIVIDFCNEISKRRLNIRWICSARVDTISEDMIIAMQQAGCRRIFLGIESASPKIQKVIRKNIKIDTIWDKVKIIRRNGIKVEAGFMYGFPYENKDDVNLSLNMMLMGAANNLWFPEIGILNVENGTELYDELKDQLFIVKDTDNLYFFNNDELDYFYDMFRDNPNISPHFYDYKNLTRQKYKYLDRFMWILVSLISLGYKVSINAIVSFYNNDILRIYNELLAEQEEEFKDIFTENLNLAGGNDENLLIRRNALLEKFVSRLIKKDNKVTLLIQELYDLDKSIVFLRTLGREQEQIKREYSNNLMEVRQCGERVSKAGNYKFIITKIDQTKVRIDCKV